MQPRFVGLVVAAVVAACVPPSNNPPSYFTQPQQPYGQPGYAQPAAPPPQGSPEQQAYPEEDPQGDSWGPNAPAYEPVPPAPAPVATAAPQAALLRCGQVITDCYRCTTGADCAQRCVTERGTPRAQWLHLAIAKCAKVQNCTVGWCVEQGCAQQMARCRADTADASAPAAPVQFEGEWSSGGVSLVGFYSPSGGFTPASSTGQSYKFGSDGRYENAIMIQTAGYGCGAGSFGYRTGRYTLEGNRLTLREEVSKVNAANGCSGKASARDVPLETRAYVVQIVPADFGGDPEMHLLDETGQEVSKPLRHR